MRLIKLVFIMVFLAGCSLFGSDPSPGCQQYITIVDEVLESGAGISKGELEFKEGEVLTVQAEPIGEMPAGVEIRRYGGEVVLYAESVPATVSYTIGRSGTQIFPIFNTGPGSIRVTVTSCE